MWPSRIVAVIGFGAFANKCAPNRRTPVPQSKMILRPASVIASTQDVLPPKRVVPAPGVAIDPRVPQNRSFNSCLRQIPGHAPVQVLQVERQFLHFSPNGRLVVRLGALFNRPAKLGQYGEAIACAGTLQIVAQPPQCLVVPRRQSLGKLWQVLPALVKI